MAEFRLIYRKGKRVDSDEHDNCTTSTDDEVIPVQVKKDNINRVLLNLAHGQSCKLSSLIVAPYDCPFVPELDLQSIRLIMHRHLTTSFGDNVRQILVFRDIIGATKNSLSTIKIVNRGSTIYPVASDEMNMKPESDKCMISHVVSNRWFKTDDYSKTVRKLVGVNNKLEVTERLLDLRGQMERIVERIDRDMILCVDYIIARIMNKIM